jgi:hypothetical protein
MTRSGSFTYSGIFPCEKSDLLGGMMTSETEGNAVLEEDELLYFNGIDGDTGQYALPPMTGNELSSFIRQESQPENLAELRYRYEETTKKTMGVRDGIDPKQLDQTGWGVIFSANANPAIKEALTGLLELRSQQAGQYFRIYEGGEGYRPDESKSQFLARHGAGPGSADPEKVPYYLLIVGSPQEIPYRFQSQLDVQYAVGRIHFEDLQEYANYAGSVVEAETGGLKLPRQASFFGVANPGDKATNLSSKFLIEAVYEKFTDELSDWKLNAYMREQATKEQLHRLLGGDQTPALLFSGSHGMSFSMESGRQIPHQGALLCQDWPGVERWRGEIPQDFYFAGDDLNREASLLGLIAFFFACYGAGTPLNDEFSKQAFKARTAIAPYPFLAQLPTKMLSHPRGGALAVIGHIERAWTYSFSWPKAGVQTAVFEDTIKRLFDGHPVGSALEYFNQRYAELSTVLADELEEIEFNKQYDPYELAGMWTANNDARGYALIGDPAVRLPVAASPTEAGSRPESISVFKVKSPSSGPHSGEPVPEGVSPEIHSTTTETTATEFGVMDSLSDARVRLTNAVKQFADNLGSTLTRVVGDASTLQVSTYVIDDMPGELGAEIPAGARLRAFTSIKIDGDTQLIVPSGAGQISQELWAIHLDMVEQAQNNRTEMMKAAASAAAGLLQSLKGL